MAKTRKEKQEIVENLTKKIEKAKTIVFTNYEGLKVKEITELRKNLKKEKAEFQVVKSRLAKQAFNRLKTKKIKVNALDLKGPKAMVLSYEDEVMPVKVLYQFSRQHKALTILGGVLGEKEMAKEEVLSLAKLPTRTELLAQIVGSMGAPVFGFVNVLAGTIRNFIYVLQAIKNSKNK